MDISSQVRAVATLPALAAFPITTTWMQLMESMEPRDWLLGGALLIGVAFGVLGRLSGFCFRSALIEVVQRRQGRQFTAWVGALLAAILGTQALAAAGAVDLTGSIYLTRSLAWGSLVLGGLLFGAGMMLARGCGARHLVLAAGGNLRSLVVLVALGLSAYATLRGILAPARTWVADAASAAVQAPDQGLATLLAATLGVEPGTVLWPLGLALAIAAAFAVVRTARRTRVLPALVAGLAIGLLVPAGWYVTGVLGFDEFEPARLESLTFTAPVGNAIQYLLTYTGASADFGIAAVAGVLAGAFAAALATGSLHAEAFDGTGPLVRYLLGGAMMGFGGVLALGCTVGAGLSGVSTLSLGSLLATAGIVAGGVLALRLTGRQHGAAPQPAPGATARV